MNPNLQRLLIWATVLGFVALGLGLLVAGWLPFPSPNRSATYVGDYYAEHRDGIRLGSILVALGAALLAPIAAVLAFHIKRIPGAGPLAYLELGMGSASPLAITIPTFFWQAAAFSPERDPDITKFAHDAGWLCITATIFLFQLQFLALAVAIFTDRSERPVFPRWLGYASVWLVVALFPSVLCLWFKTGPFGWNGAFSLYLAFIAVGIYLTALIVVLLRVVRDAAPQPA